MLGKSTLSRKNLYFFLFFLAIKHPVWKFGLIDFFKRWNFGFVFLMCMNSTFRNNVQMKGYFPVKLKVPFCIFYWKVAMVVTVYKQNVRTWGSFLSFVFGELLKMLKRLASVCVYKWACVYICEYMYENTYIVIYENVVTE